MVTEAISKVASGAAGVEVKVSRGTADWLLREAAKDISHAFNTSPPHHCKLCDQPVAKVDQPGHVQEHRDQLRSLGSGDPRVISRATSDPEEINRWLADAADALRG